MEDLLKVLASMSPYAVILLLAGVLFLKTYSIGIEANKQMAKDAILVIRQNSDSAINSIREAYRDANR